MLLNEEMNVYPHPTLQRVFQSPVSGLGQGIRVPPGIRASGHPEPKVIKGVQPPQRDSVSRARPQEDFERPWEPGRPAGWGEVRKVC